MLSRNTLAKLDRAQALVDYLHLASAENATSVSAWGETRPHKAICIEMPSSPWRARIIEGQRATIGWLTENSIGERRLLDEECQVVELTIRGKLEVVVNLRNGQLELHYFRPGLWESWFGLDRAGDDITFDRWVSAYPNDPAYQAFLLSDDAKLPPLRQTVTHLDVAPPRRRQKRLR